MGRTGALRPRCHGERARRLAHRPPRGRAGRRRPPSAALARRDPGEPRRRRRRRRREPARRPTARARTRVRRGRGAGGPHDRRGQNRSRDTPARARSGARDPGTPVRRPLVVNGARTRPGRGRGTGGRSVRPPGLRRRALPVHRGGGRDDRSGVRRDVHCWQPPHPKVDLPRCRRPGRPDRSAGATERGDPRHRTDEGVGVRTHPPRSRVRTPGLPTWCDSPCGVRGGF